MQNDIIKMKDLFKNPIEPKLLLIPNRSMKIQVLKTLVDNGIETLNLTVTTINDLVTDIAKPEIISKNKRVIDSNGVNDLIADVSKKLKDEKKLKYFFVDASKEEDEEETKKDDDTQTTGISIGLCKALSKTISELLEYGYSTTDKSLLDKVIENEKREDLEQIIERYINAKEKHDYVDYADLLGIANDIVKPPKGKEKQKSVKGYALETCDFLPKELEILNNLGIKYDNATELESLNIKDDLVVDFFEAYGDYNEMKEVFRLILNKKATDDEATVDEATDDKVLYDEVLIVAPSSSPYDQLIYQFAQHYYPGDDKFPRFDDLPITLDAGLPLVLSSSARLLNQLLDLIESDYNCKQLIELFSTGVLFLEKDKNSEPSKKENTAFSPASLVYVIKRAKLKWDRDTYLPCFENFISKLDEEEKSEKPEEPDELVELEQQEEQEESDESEQGDLTERRRNVAKQLIEFTTNYILKIPEPEKASEKASDKDKLIDFKSFISSLKNIVVKYGVSRTDIDKIGKEETLKVLQEPLISKKIKLDEAIAIIRKRLSATKICASSPKSGKIHFTTYNNANWINRKHVYLIGLSADNFPGMNLEDPILLDDERDNSPLRKSDDRIKQNISYMYTFIQNISGKLTCSYSEYDTVKLRKLNKSMLFDELSYSYRNTLSEELQKKYKPRQVGFIQKHKNHLDLSDYWISKSISTNLMVESPQNLESCDENIIINEDKLKEMHFSASSLGNYLECRYRFFLNKVLKLREIDEGQLNAAEWLPASELGTFYHTIIEKFSESIITNDKTLITEKSATDAINKIAEDVFKEYEKVTPVGSVHHKVLDKEEIYKNLEKLAIREVDDKAKRKIIRTELKYGYEQESEESSETSLASDKTRVEESDKAFRICLTDAKAVEEVKIKIRGSIDRVDKVGDMVEIIDHKSGRTYGFDDEVDPHEELNKYNIQLVIYYLALKEIAKREGDKSLGNIGRFTFRFITLKGDYSEISVEIMPDSESAFKSKLLEIYNNIKQGIFSPIGAKMSDAEGTKLPDTDKKTCNYCGYKTVCKYYDELQED